MNVGQRIKQRREELNISAEDLGKKIGKAKTTIYRYELGYIEKMPTTVLSAIANALQTTPAYLMGWTDGREASNIYNVDGITVFEELGTVCAGYNGSVNEIPTGKKVEIPTSMLKGGNQGNYFVLRVNGNSMYPRLLDGDTILCQRCNSVDSGDYAVILYNGDEATVKKVIYETGKDWLELIPINPEYQKKRIEGSDLEQCRILGKVIKLIRDL